MSRALAVAIAAFALCSGSGARADDLLPRPPGLEPNVRFWTRIYAEVDTRGGLIHDSVHLGVVYEVLRFPAGSSAPARERLVERTKNHYRAILRTLAQGKRTGLSADQARVLARWPEGVSNASLRAAAGQVRFQLGQADKFRAGLVRAGAWRGHIERVLPEHGVPAELIALPHVESSFEPRAYSRVGAAGLWQFTHSTGRRYLQVDHVVDERMDPEKATIAAARLLRDNYRHLKTWPLAITAYNHGVGGMQRAVRMLGTRDIAEISHRYQSRSFGFASRNFYAEFLAASGVDRNAERYFGPLQPEAPADRDVIRMDHYYAVSSLERALGIDSEVLRRHNPSLRPAVWNGAKYVPEGFELQVPRGALPAPAPALLASIPAAERMAEQHRDRFYTVRRGDILSKIARRYGVRESELVAVNNLRSRHHIRAGQVLRLPDGAEAPPAPVVIAAAPADGVHEVRRGDTLSTIARRYGVSESQLVAANGLSNKHRIAVGQRLLLAGETAPVSVAAEPPQAVAAAVWTPPPEPPAAAPEVEAAIAAPAREASTPGPPASADPSNYAVTADHRITVQAEETLGHYAEWLEIGASRLRRLNGMRAGAPVVIGRRTKLDFSRVAPETFLARRLEYHRTLQEEFFEAWQVASTETHVLRRGDTLWHLAREKYDVPVWLLRQFNPDLDFSALAPGQRMVIPRLEPRRS